jgi:hypothetical protein
MSKRLPFGSPPGPYHQAMTALMLVLGSAAEIAGVLLVSADVLL